MRFSWLLGPLAQGRRIYEAAQLLLANSAAGRRIAALGAACTIAAPPIAFVSDVQALTEPACRIEMVKSLACRPIGLGGVPTQGEERRYNLALARGCPGLRDFVASDTRSPLVDDATRLLTARRTVAEFRPAPPATMEVSAQGVGSTQTEARAAFLKDAADGAARACEPLKAAREHRLLGVAPRPISPVCEQIGARWICSAQGLTDCRVEARVVREVCG